ncbi:polynucleotide 5'-hydroxyl-kinase NOL9 [Bombyx mandarina]|uniref:Polynucleotide 5'-hydroxyl-kinase NOL9 n=1 Tax=Bombyx mandarina TaxID=7092 RepID=A0A6J2J8R8_BOMMA|nr:polynucleotide 5'-hydroxyl-kinase NOL9 [Bombyx mandarina]
MDFFEKAHVVKNETSKEKSNLLVKKQLKQMLRGYKQSDNKLIQEATILKSNLIDPALDFDDNTSVSGFSDLNLTNSSLDSLTPNTEKTQDKSLDDNDFSDLVNDEQIVQDIDESISESNDDIQSLSEVSEETSDIKSDESDVVSLINSLGESSGADVYETESDDFDTDGALASTILKNLKNKSNEGTKTKKRKLDPIDSASKSMDKFDSMLKSKKKLNKNTIKKNKIKNSDTANESPQSDDINSSSSSTNSLPYISIKAANMPEQNLNEILGKYCHPTVKNLLSDCHTAVKDFSIFSTESINSSEIEIEEEADSLVPELGDVAVIDELEAETNPETLTEIASIAVDETMPLENISNEEDSVDFTNKPNLDSVQIYYGTKHCVFVLKHPAILYFHGKVTMRALGGQMEVFGYNLKDQYQEVYAPRLNYALSVKTVESENNYQGLFSKLTAVGISVKEAEEIVTTLGEYDGILSLGPLKDYKMDFVENNFSICELFTKTKNVESCFHRASDILGCSLYLKRPLRTYEERPQWEQAYTYGTDSGARGIICGGKGTGKSTMLRYLCNRLLDHGPVLVIDLDPGQAEFTVAGNLSVTIVNEPLLGPNFTHLKTPEKMLNIGMISPMDNPTRYASAVQDIIAYCHQTHKYRSMPWVINTMGMTNNLGLKFMLLTILAAKPTFLCQIYCKSYKKQFECPLQSNSVRRLCEFYKNDRLLKNTICPEYFDYNFMTFITVNESSNQPKRAIPLMPRDERYLNYLAYFGELLNMHQGTNILGIVPYSVELKNLCIGLNVRVPEDTVTKVINGKIVALCKLTTVDKGKMFTLGDKAIPCLGNGLVRCVDLEKQVLYIITPLPVGILSQVNTLVYSDWAPEIVGQEKYLPDNIIVPYRITSQQKQKQLMITPRRRFNPLVLLNMSRKT